MKCFFIFLSCSAASVALLTSCKTDRQTGRSGMDVLSGEETEDLTQRIEHIKKVYYLCPSPAEMLSIIDVSKNEFNGELLNSPGNAEKYFDIKTQTVNLGIYITDLAYSALFGRHQETIDYLETIQSLSEEIRVTGDLNDELFRRVESNVTNLDSLFTISNEAFTNMLTYCEKNSRSNSIALLSTGAFIESLFLAINTVGEYQEADQLINHLADQKYALDNLVSFAESMPGDESVASMLADIQPIINIYKGLESTKQETTVRKESDNRLVIGGGKKIILPKEDFLLLKKETRTIRNKITENTGS
jgi:hypothetical protein